MLSLPSPRDLGLPERFTHWRPLQAEALRKLLSSTKRIKALSAPTGFGKTLVYIAYALIKKQPTCIVTESRGLQDQLTQQFSEIGLVDVRGRRNYDCHLRDGYTCEDGAAARCPYKGTIGCPSSQAEMRAAVSWLVVTNYDKWTSARKFGQGMEHFKVVVFDEFHKGHAALSRAMQVTLNAREIDDLGVDLPTHPAAEDFVTWKVWATATRPIAEEAMNAAQASLRASAHPKPSVVRAYTHLRHLTRRLAILQTANPLNWVADETRDGYQMDPIRPGRYGESALLMRIPDILCVSATLRPKSMYMCGIGKDAFDYQEYPSEFDRSRAPIYYVPTQFVDTRHPDLSALWARIDQIAARRQDRKGIIHTISYNRRDQVVQASRFRNAMLVNQKGEAATELVETFKASDPGTILVSPSVGAGYDFPGRECEWQVVCKLPFPDSRSKIMKAREHDDPEYGAYLTMSELVQIFGRGMRHAKDRCESFIGDRNLEWFLPRYGYLAPKSFHGFYQRVETLPTPPPRL